jgi:hypothetical protein
VLLSDFADEGVVKSLLQQAPRGLKCFIDVLKCFIGEMFSSC